MKAIDRLFQYFDYKQVKPTRFEKDHGLSNGYLGIQLKRGSDIGSSIIEKIIDNCRDLDIRWLITGSGKMLINGVEDFVEEPKEHYRINHNMEPPGCERCKMKDDLIDSLKQQIGLQKKIIEQLEKGKVPVGRGQQRKPAT